MICINRIILYLKTRILLAGVVNLLIPKSIKYGTNTFK